MNDVLFSTGKDDWETPQDLFDRLDAEFHFNLDPCASSENAKCKDYFTEHEDGLLQDWGGGACSSIHLILQESRTTGLRSVTKKA